MKTEVKLPPAVEHYLRTVNSGDAEEFAESFADDALVEDVDRRIEGIEAIKKWSRQDIFAVRARFDVVTVAEHNGRTLLTVKIDGTFDRTGLPDPLLMNQSFLVARGKIAELKVTFASRAAG